MTAAAHCDAIVARLRAHPDLASIVFVGDVPAKTTKYVVVFPSTPAHSVERFTGANTQEDYTYTINSVGLQPAQALWVADRVVTQLLDFTPTVAGRKCRRLRHPVGRPVDRDKDVTPNLFYAVDQFDLTSSPA